MSFLTQIIFEHIIIHWGLCFVLTMFDLVTGPKYKIRKLFIPDSWCNIFFCVVINQVFITFPCLYLFGNFSNEPFLSWQNLYKLPLTLLYEEIFFYTTHKILHSQYLYKKIHKIHHRWTSPAALSATYAHPFEHFFSNVAPIILAARFAGLGKEAARFWHAFALFNTILFSHGGYVSNLHDKHHTDFNCNFGVLGLLDYIFGTLRM